MIDKATIPVFIYWENPPGQKMPAFIALCIETARNNIRPPFQLIFLTPTTIEDYLDDIPSEIWEIHPNSLGNSFSNEVRSIALRSGILRWGLLYHYGGIWLDADTIVFDRFNVFKNYIKDYDFIAQWSEDGWPINSFMYAKKGSVIAWNCWWRACSLLEITTGLNWGQAGFRLARDVIHAFPDASCYQIKKKHIIYLTDDGREDNLIDPGDIPESIWLLGLNASSFGSTIRKKSKEELLLSESWRRVYEMALAS